MSISQLRAQLKNLRNEHAAKPLSKMTEAEIQREISHHEMGCKARTLKENRIQALAKARETKAKAKEETATHVKIPELKKKKAEPKTEHDAPTVPKKEVKPKKTVKAKEEVEEEKEVKKPSRSTKVMKIVDDDEE